MSCTIFSNHATDPWFPQEAHVLDLYNDLPSLECITRTSSLYSAPAPHPALSIASDTQQASPEIFHMRWYSPTNFGDVPPTLTASGFTPGPPVSFGYLASNENDGLLETPIGDIGPFPNAGSPLNTNAGGPPYIPDISGRVAFRVETRKVFVCTHANCHKKFSRLPDLHRHHRGTHQEYRPYKCRGLGCERAMRGFPRRDKRDAHERKMHVKIAENMWI